MTLVGNIKFQLASVAALFFVMISWIAIFVKHGLNQSIPAIGDNQSSLVGFVLNNFAFVRLENSAPFTNYWLLSLLDYHCTLFHKRAFSYGFHTQGHLLSYCHMCSSVFDSWPARCCKLQDQQLNWYSRNTGSCGRKQGSDNYSQYSLPGFCSRYIGSSICYCNSLQSRERQCLFWE